MQPTLLASIKEDASVCDSDEQSEKIIESGIGSFCQNSESSRSSIEKSQTPDEKHDERIEYERDKINL